MTYDTFNTIATQLGDGARVDVKIKGKWYRNILLIEDIIYGIGAYVQKTNGDWGRLSGPYSPNLPGTEELIIHSPQEL